MSSIIAKAMRAAKEDVIRTRVGKEGYYYAWPKSWSNPNDTPPENAFRGRDEEEALYSLIKTLGRGQDD